MLKNIIFKLIVIAGIVSVIILTKSEFLLQLWLIYFGMRWSYDIVMNWLNKKS